MAHRVMSAWTGNVNTSGYITKSTKEEFWTMVENGVTTDEFIAGVDAQNLADWPAIKDTVVSVMKSVPVEETFDVDTQTYTKTVEWPTIEDYNAWKNIRLAYSTDTSFFGGKSLFSDLWTKVSEAEV